MSALCSRSLCSQPKFWSSAQQSWKDMKHDSSPIVIQRRCPTQSVCQALPTCRHTRRYRSREQSLMSCCSGRLAATNHCPQDNSELTRAGNQTLLTAESNLLGYARKKLASLSSRFGLSGSVGQYFRQILERKHRRAHQVQL